MKPYRRLLDSVAGSAAFAWFGRRVLSPLDKRIGDRIPLLAGTELPVVRLETIGRRTGEPRTTVLLYTATPAGDLAVAGTNFGSGSAPSWTFNLDARPEALASIDGADPVPVRTRRATDQESPAIWAALDELWPAFRTYRDRADRTIPLYVLQRDVDPT